MGHALHSPLVIPLHRRGEVVAYAKVDETDHERLSRFRWYLTPNGYAVRYARVRGRRTSIFMHREVVGLPQGGGHERVAHHLNADRLDNRSANLRIVSSRENRRTSRAFGRSGVKGVYWSSSCGKWNARLDLGHFDTVEEAAAVIEAVKRAAALA
jgi:HNH endonuclease